MSNYLLKILYDKYTNNKELSNDSFFKDITAMEMRDPNHELQNGNIICEIINELNKSETKIDNYKLNVSQIEIYNSMKLNKQLFIAADTSFGKTWLSIAAIKHHISNNITKKITIIFIVTTDILSSEVTSKIIDGMKEMEDINISNRVDNSRINIIIGTSEKIFQQLKKIKSVEYLILDEAHEMFYVSDERSKFYLHVFQKIYNKYAPTTWMIGAFLTNKNYGYLKNNISDEFKLVKGAGFSSNFLIEKDDKLYYKNFFVQKEKNIDNDGVSLFYFSSKQKCVEKFNEEIAAYSALNFSYYVQEEGQKNREHFDKINEYLDRYGSKNYNSNETRNNYNVLIGLKLRKAILISDIPTDIKLFVYKSIRDGHVDNVYCTSTIMSGIDFPITNIYIDKLFEGPSRMNSNNFLNLCGRAGRYNPKGNQPLGIIHIMKDEIGKKYNENWWNDNYEYVLSRRKRKYNNKKKIHNIDLSLKVAEDAKGLLKESYLIDPRIHPKITKTLMSMELFKLDSIYKNILECLKLTSSGADWKNIGEQEVSKRMDKFWEIYCSDSKIKIETQTNSDIEHWASLKLIKLMIMTSQMSESGIYTKYANAWSGKMEINFSKKMQELSETYSKGVKHGLITYVIHFVKICELRNLTKKDFDIEALFYDKK